MKLAAGSRYRLTDGDTFAELQKGKLEIYAVTSQENPFHQTYLIEIEPGGAAFPSMDEFEEIEIMLYAVEDSEITEKSFENTPVSVLFPLMRAWFQKLITVRWLTRARTKTRFWRHLFITKLFFLCFWACILIPKTKNLPVK